MEQPNAEQKKPLDLPVCVERYIAEVVRRMRDRRRAREEVHAELTAHFEDELRDSTSAEEKEQRARRLIEEFGDAKLLAVLCRRAKKRCRPLWQKALLRSAQALGVLVLYLVACSVPLFLGKPTVRVNYAEWLSERWRPARQDTENTKGYYDQAAALYVEPPQTLVARKETAGWTVRDCNEADLELLARWLGENQAAFDMLRKGASTADYWPVYDVNESNQRDVPFLWLQANIMPDVMETLKGYRPIARAFKDWTAYQTRLGAVDEAMSDCLVILRFGLHLEGKGLLIEQMVGIAIEALGYGAMYDVLQSPDIPVGVLARVQDELAFALDEDRCVIHLDGEKAFWYDNIQRTFTDDGQGGGRALRYGLPFAAGDWWDNLAGVLLFDYPDRREAVAMVEAYFEQAQEALRTPPDRKEPSAEQEERVRAIQKQNLLLSLVVPAYDRLAQLAWRIKTHGTAVVTTLALLRYGAETGSYPARLEELVKAGTLARLPDDPFGEGPLTYERTADGFLLYSWGENRKDDGGRQGAGRDGQPKMWADNGDWVFWPVHP
jgi:hypothetical protein